MKKDGNTTHPWFIIHWGRSNIGWEKRQTLYTWLIWSWPDCFYKVHRKGNLYQMQTKHCSCSIRKDVPSWKVRKAGDFTWRGTSTSSLKEQTRRAALKVQQLASSAFWQTWQLLIHTDGKTSLGKHFLPTIEIFYYLFT